MIYNQTKQIVDDIVKEKVGQARVCLDMTLGNGKDLENILQHNDDVKVYAFDIQEKCIDLFYSKIKENHYRQDIKLICDSHANVDLYVKENIDFAIYNLGYLPKGDKNIHTKYGDVIESLKKILRLLNKGGIIVMTLYPGFAYGLEEADKVIDFLSTLDQKLYKVLRYDFINQINNPPFVVAIERI
ncbi:MAG: class I SAM-dependent methyltransferase [Finegoldia sp.]|nr:class I SAM-dependent methyltransferase [Finegoldia sp.]